MGLHLTYYSLTSSRPFFLRIVAHSSHLWSSSLHCPLRPHSPLHPLLLSSQSTVIAAFSLDVILFPGPSSLHSRFDLPNVSPVRNPDREKPRGIKRVFHQRISDNRRPYTNELRSYEQKRTSHILITFPGPHFSIFFSSVVFLNKCFGGFFLSTSNDIDTPPRLFILWLFHSLDTE